MANVYDAIIVGGGHNGLISGAFFAKGGARTVILEARRKTGGAAATSSPWPEHPDFKVTTYSYVMSLMPPTIIRELKLERHGYKVTPFGPYYQAYPDGRAIKLYADDAKKNYESISQFSKKDAESIPTWDAWLSGVADVLGPLLLKVPPKVGSMKPKDLLESLRVAWAARGLAIRGVGDGHLGSWGYQEGGMGAVSDACRRSAESFGAEIRTGARVAKILVRGGRAVGVALENGEELRAPVVVSCVHPKIAFLKLVDRSDLPPDFVRDIERWKTRSGVVKINLAMSELPDFIADPGKNLQDHHTGSVELCFSPRYAEEAFQDAHLHRKGAERPFVDGVIPTTLDRSLMPEGVHNFSMFAQWVPADWVDAPHHDELEQFADRVVDIYTELAPNFKSAVIARQVLGPYDMEQELGLIGGKNFPRGLSVDQLFHIRPAPGYADYRPPIRGLYHRSSATHAGGGVCGIPGWQAFRQAKKDRAVARGR